MNADQLSHARKYGSYKTEPVHAPALGPDLPQFMHFVELWLSFYKATGAFYVRIRLSSQQPWVDIFLHRVLRLTHEWSDWRDSNSRPLVPIVRFELTFFSLT